MLLTRRVLAALGFVALLTGIGVLEGHWLAGLLVGLWVMFAVAVLNLI